MRYATGETTAGEWTDGTLTKAAPEVVPAEGAAAPAEGADAPATNP